MLMAPITLAAFLLSAVTPEPAVLTPMTMADHGFYLKCVIYRPLPSEATRVTSATELPHVSLHFDPVRGPAIQAAKSVSLVVRDGDKPQLSVPVQPMPYFGNDGGIWVRFRMREESLSNARLLIETQGNGWFIIAPKAFLTEKDTRKKDLTNTTQSFHERLRGKWLQQSREVNGKRLDDPAGVFLLFADDGMMKNYAPGGSSEGPGPTLVRNVYFRIDETKDLTTIDQTRTSDWTEVTEGKGICRVENDVLTLCFSAKNEPRPTTFSTDPLAGGGRILTVYKRVVSGRK